MTTSVITGFRLSPQQERTWRFQAGVSAGIYRTRAEAIVDGPLDPDAVRRRAQALVEQHEIFRTSYRFLPGVAVPVQVIADAAALSVRVEEPSAGADGDLDALDVSGERLTDVRLEPLPDRLWRVVVTLPALSADAFTAVRVLEHLIAADGGAPSGPHEHSPLQYADVAEWQHRAIAEGSSSIAEAWGARRAPTRAPFRLPRERTPAGESGRLRAIEVPLSAGVMERLASRSAAWEVDERSVVLAAWAVLLARLSQRSHGMIGVGFDGRPYPELRAAYGPLAKYLPLPVSIEKEATLAGVARDVQRDSLALEPWQEHFDHALLRSDANPAGDFRWGFDFYGLTSGFRVRSVAEPFAGRLTCVRFAEQHIALELVSDPRVLDEDAAMQVRDGYAALLEHALTAPDTPVARLAIVGEAGRTRLLSFNPQREPADVVAVLDRVERTAARQPDAVAVSDGTTWTTYGELNRRAASVARWLIEQGVAPGDRVGICLPRTPDAIAALLGVWKAGAAYVPCDTSWPAARIDYVVRDTDARLVITDISPAIDRPPVSARLPARRPSDLAYVIYTSGSTGHPKGVAISQESLASYVDGVCERLSLPGGTSFAIVTTLAADLGHTALFTSLASRGCLHVVPEAIAADAVALGRYLREHQVQAIKMVPSHLRAVLAVAETSGQPLAVECVVSGGDSLDRALIERVRGLGRCRLLNHYGPTETTVGALCDAVGSDGGAGDAVPLGRPLGSAQVYVADPALELAPVGSPGEIVIGGTGVAWGYWRRADITAARFVPDPFGRAGGQRLYRTGDSGAWTADGAVQFLGRADHQVKIRGYRVELGEIESELRRHPRVRDAVVIATGDAGDRQLRAFAAGVADDGESELRAFLAARLPAYMVPSIRVLDQLPRTANGKIDRQALETLPAPAQETVEPATWVEEIVAAIWGEVLHRPHVGLHDDFFALGGHSLSVTQVVSRVQATFGCDVTMQSVFDAPTVRGLARRIEAAIGRRPAVTLPASKPAPQASSPLSFGQERLWFLHQMDPANPTYNVPMGIRLMGRLARARLERAVGAVVRRHEILRTIYLDEGGQTRPHVCAIDRWHLATIDLGGIEPPRRETLVARLRRREALRPFDLSRAVPFRAHLLRLGPDQHLLLLTVHHIACDAWSRDILAGEIERVYRGPDDAADRDVPLQYRDYAAWQRDLLQGEYLAGLLGFWRTALSDAPVLDLPTDHPRPPVFSTRAATRRFTVGRDRLAQLQALSRSEGSTLFMTLIAAYGVLLYRYTGQRDFVVGTPIASRVREDWEAVIGFFVNMLPIRFRIHPRATFREVLSDVRHTCLAAYAHQDLPFERLVAELNPDRDVSRSPICQVAFQLQNLPTRAGEPEISRMAIGDEVALQTGAKFDVTLGLAHDGDGLRGWLEYSDRLFDAATIERMADQYASLLKAAVDDPDRRVVDLHVASKTEQAAVDVWAGTLTQARHAELVSRQFARRADATPDAIAAVSGADALTYREVEHRSRRLAARLQQLGVEPEVRVGVLLDRSVDALVAILSVFRAGGAYLPLDPDWPPARLSLIVRDAGARIAITNQQRAAQLDSSVTPVFVGDVPAEAYREPELSNDNLAYVIYTSGSTGQPKGVLISQGAFARHVEDFAEGCGFSADDRVLQFSSLTFDASLDQIFPTWLRGGCVMFRAAELWDARELQRNIVRFEPTVINLPTAYWDHLVDQLREHTDTVDPHTVRLLILGGDALTLDSVRRWRRLERWRVPILNGYGPTETTITASLHDTHAAEGQDSAWRVPIGRPLPARAFRVMDAEWRQTLPGLPGELWIGGETVARGYLNRPDLTAERFRPDAFAATPGARAYATGDRARWLRSGDVECLGRVDRQVKIRGNRLELGEIEAVLRSLPGVADALVTVRGSGASAHLVAYVVPEAHGRIADTALRDEVRSRLPIYMVPAFFVVLERLPLNRHGKIAREALPEPDAVAIGDTAMRDGVEEQIAALWREVLGQPRVNRDSNFFDAGGNSLLLLRLRSRIAATFGHDMPIVTLMQNPTVASMRRLVARDAAPDVLDRSRDKAARRRRRRLAR